MQSVHILSNAISKERCKELIEECDSKDKIFINDSSYSVYYRYDFVDKQLSKYIEDILYKAGLSAKLGKKWFFTKYLPGGFINAHRDGHVSIDNVRSKYSVLIYLNDNYPGGELSFEGEIVGSIKPKEGTIIVMDQDLWHRGNPITHGMKYLLRADMV